LICSSDSRSIRAQELVLLHARIVRPHERMARLVLCRQAQVGKASLLYEMAREVGLVEPLHDDDHGVGAGLVEPRRHRPVPPTEHRLPGHVRLRLVGLVGVVDDDPVAPLAGGHSVHRGGDAIARARVLKPLLGRLVAGQRPRLLAAHRRQERDDAHVADALDERAL